MNWLLKALNKLNIENLKAGRDINVIFHSTRNTETQKREIQDQSSLIHQFASSCWDIWDYHKNSSTGCKELLIMGCLFGWADITPEDYRLELKRRLLEYLKEGINLTIVLQKTTAQSCIDISSFWDLEFANLDLLLKETEKACYLAKENWDKNSSSNAQIVILIEETLLKWEFHGLFTDALRQCNSVSYIVRIHQMLRLQFTALPPSQFEIYEHLNKNRKRITLAEDERLKAYIKERVFSVVRRGLGE